jgi:capsular polysaccharide biosynthesis protein
MGGMMVADSQGRVTVGAKAEDTVVTITINCPSKETADAILLDFNDSMQRHGAFTIELGNPRKVR